MGNDLAIGQLYMGDGRTVSVTHHVSRHHHAVYACVFQREVADFRVCDAAEQPHRPGLRLIDYQVADGMSLPVKCSGKGSCHVRNFSLFSATGNECTNGCPFCTRQINICCQNEMTGRILVDLCQLFRGVNFNYLCRRICILSDPADDAVIRCKGQDGLSILVHRYDIGSRLRLVLKVTPCHIQPLTVAFLTAVHRVYFKVGCLCSVHGGNTVAVFIDCHGKVNSSILLPIGTQICLPFADKPQVLQLCQGCFTVNGVIHIFRAEKIDYIFNHVCVRIHRETGSQPIGIRAFVVFGQIFDIAAIAEFQVISSCRRIRHHKEIPELPCVLIGTFIEVAFHHSPEQQLADISIFVAEYRIAVLVCTADNTAVEGNGGDTVDKQAVKLRSVGTVTKSGNSFLPTDRTVAGCFQYLCHLGCVFFTQNSAACL